MNMNFDLDRFAGACQHLEVFGNPRGREKVIEEAIALIQENPEKALLRGYLGVKNYAHFGDQRHDGAYGMGPSHGSIVFSIGRERDYKGPLGNDHIYLLECVRDFGTAKILNAQNKEVETNLFGVVLAIVRTRVRLTAHEAVLHGFTPDTHV